MKVLFLVLMIVFAIDILRIIGKIYYMNTLSYKIAKKYYWFDDFRSQDYNSYKDKDDADRFFTQ